MPSFDKWYDSEESLKGIYQRLLDAGCEISNHCSDLYTPVNATSCKIVEEYRKLSRNCVTIFNSQEDGSLWYDIPFAYMPYWEKRAV